jgi:hypothetical protein
MTDEREQLRKEIQKQREELQSLIKEATEHKDEANARELLRFLLSGEGAS